MDAPNSRSPERNQQSARNRGTDVGALLESWRDRLHAPVASLDAWLHDATRAVAHALGAELGAMGRIWDARPRRTLGNWAIACEHEALRTRLELQQRNTQHRIDFLLDGSSTLRSLRRTVTTHFGHDGYLTSMRDNNTDLGADDLQHLTLDDGNGGWLTVGIITSRAWRRPSNRRIALVSAALREGFVAHRAVQELGHELGLRSRDDLQHVAELHDTTGAALNDAAALDVWTCALDQAWLIASDHQANGRHYRVVTAAAPGLGGRGGPLTPHEARVSALAAEGHANKWIGTTLGIEPSTVATHLTRAMTRLGVSSRVELAARFKLLAHGRPDPRGLLAMIPVPVSGLRVTPLTGDAFVIAFDTHVAVQSQPENALPPGERRVVELALQSLSDREIAQQLGLSRHTVANQLRSAYARLGVNSRAELFARLRREGCLNT